MGNNEHDQATVDEKETQDQESQHAENIDEQTEAINVNVEETESPAGSGLDEDIEALRAQLEASRQEAEDNRDKVMRAQAELQNMQKRAARDIENAHKYALEKFLTDLLPVLDSLELGIDASGNAEEVASLREGMDLTLKMFQSTLEKAGIVVIDPQGEKFNPQQHEAVTMQESAENKSGTVMSVMQKGYELNGRLVRPAMVIVAK